jgi:hypothetical protein
MRPSVVRLRTILDRQGEDRFDGKYVPAILATPREAPSISNASRVRLWELGGRWGHLLSPWERHVLVLGLHLRCAFGFFDVHEQKMLSPIPRVHPLFSHPRGAGLDLPPFRGTIDVAQRLGEFRLHPVVRLAEPASLNGFRWVAFPFVGDLLWFLEDAAGPYCVNQNVKRDDEDFRDPGRTRRFAKNLARSQERAQFRLQVEKLYYADAGIRTAEIAAAKIDFHVSANLSMLLGLRAARLSISPAEREELVERFEVALDLPIAPCHVIHRFCGRYRRSFSDGKAVLYQAIWNRRLRVDLFRPVLVDKPLKREIHDLADVYRGWFARSAC